MKRLYYFVGIGGVGMSPLARILLRRGERVAGYDAADNARTRFLAEEGAALTSHIEPIPDEVTALVYSTAIPPGHPLRQEARARAIPELHRSQMLAQLAEGQRSIAIAGAHGKSTTSALLSHLLHSGGLDASYAIGSPLCGTPNGGYQGTHPLFVFEADESDGSLLAYRPRGGILTNIDREHLDHYGSEEKLIETMRAFVEGFERLDSLIWNFEDPRLRAMALGGLSYGFDPRADIAGSALRQEGWKIYFDLDFRGRRYRNLSLPMIGRHNGSNALAACGMALLEGVSEEELRFGLQSFPGLRRRQEIIATPHTITLIDDYAHHTAEIAATLQGVRKAIGEGRLIALYEPHRYSRTRAMRGSFAAAFRDADLICVTDIASAGETPIPGITAEAVAAEIGASYLPRGEIIERLLPQLRPADTLLSLGAGDIGSILKQIGEHLQTHPPAPIALGILFGGRSDEHPISIRSARSLWKTASLSPYLEPHPFAISRSGKWLTPEESLAALQEPSIETLEEDSQPFLDGKTLQNLYRCDLLFPITHGPYGEDGTLQGFLETLGLPYIGCPTHASALCMQKEWCKKIALHHSIATSPFATLSRRRWEEEGVEALREPLKQLPWPLVAKPSRLGSAIGVSRVESWEELEKACREIFALDTLALVESWIEGRELEVPLIGNEIVRALPPGEILRGQKLYSYSGKYSDGGEAIEALPHAELPPAIEAEILETATRLYRLFGCRGMARIDFFLDHNQKLWFNEVNTLPGFTSISLYPQICSRYGLEGDKLLLALASLALRAKERTP